MYSYITKEKAYIDTNNKRYSKTYDVTVKNGMVQGTAYRKKLEYGTNSLLI